MEVFPECIFQVLDHDATKIVNSTMLIYLDICG